MEILKIDIWCNLPENYTGIVDYHDGDIHYYLNGLHHREDGPAIIYSDGRMYYFLNGERHREDGPAIIWKDGTIEYYLNGKRHREDGPAIIYSDGRMYYFLNDKNITEEIEEWIKDNNIPKVWDNSQKILFKLTFG